MGRNPNVSKILDKVHKRMLAQYNPRGALKKDIEDAKVLSDFLYILKQRAMSRKGSNSFIKLQNDIYDMILDNIELPNHRSVAKLFTRIGEYNKITGQQFEDDLGAVIAAVVNLASNDKHTTFEDFSLGNVAGTTDIDLLSGIETVTKKYVKNIANLTQEELEKNNPGFVLGKIDTYVKGEIVNVNGSIDFPPGVLEALSNATFSDKAYRSTRWDKELQERVQIGDKEIHLGNSNPFRAVLGTMSSLGFSKSDAQYVFYAGRNIVNGLDNEPPPEEPDFVGQHIYHLRYVYELTGAGILYKDYGSDFVSGARFLVYNDPDSENITVVATSQIISELLNSEKFPKNPYGIIGVSTLSLLQMNK